MAGGRSRWSIHPDEHGVWRPDWADVEPNPIPVPTIGWLTWQIDWWWSTALDDLRGHAHRGTASARPRGQAPV